MSDATTRDSFDDPALKAALQRAANQAPRSLHAPAELRSSVEALFGDAAPATAAESISVKSSSDHARARRRWLGIGIVAATFATAALVGVITIWQLDTNSAPVAHHDDHHEEDEYLVPHDELWPAMAKLAAPASANTATLDAASLARDIGAPAVAIFQPDSGWTLKSWERRDYLGVPAAVLHYEREGKSVALVSSPAAKLLKDPTEEEPYNEAVEGIRLAGGNRKGVWTCALAREDAFDADALAKLLDQTTPVAAN